MSVRQAANRFGAPRATLHGRLQAYPVTYLHRGPPTSDINQSPAAPPKQGRYPVIPAEEDPVGRVLYLSDVFYDLDKKNISSVT